MKQVATTTIGWCHLYKNSDRRQGVELVWYDYSEPQAGRDVSERILCPFNASVRRYCNEGHDAVSAKGIETVTS